MRRVFALLVVLLLSLPSGAFAATSYLCKMSGRVGSSCCCKSNAQKRFVSDSARPSDQARQDDCCEKQSRAAASDRGAQLAEDAGVPSAVPTLLATLPPVVVLQRSSSTVLPAPTRARAPPRRAVPIYVLNRALLS